MEQAEKVKMMKAHAEAAAARVEENKANMIREFRTDPNNMANWFPVLQASGVQVPRTVLVDLDYDTCGDFVNVFKSDRTDLFCEMIQLAGRSLMPTLPRSVFIRSGIMSGKHSWKNSCFLDNDLSLRTIWEHVTCIIHDNAMAFGASMPTCFAVREMLKTEPAFYAFWGDMPITMERRYFVKDGKVVCHHPYWPLRAFDDQPFNGVKHVAELAEKLQELNKETEPEIELLTRLSERAAKFFPGYWSMDWLFSKGNWYCIDMAQGARSYHWENCERKMDNVVTATE